MPAEPASCPVCRSDQVAHFATVAGRTYRRCGSCAATFLDRAYLPDPESEAARYREHRNHADDPGYVNHLRRLAEPMLARLSPASTGLDLGCGPSPALAGLFTAAGHSVRRYDPLFLPDPEALRETYDFIACSEVVEHFHRPALEFARLDRLLGPGGLLGVMTCLLEDDRGFADWHYRRDATHVVFYKPDTFRRIAARHGWSCELPAPGIALMGRPRA